MPDTNKRSKAMNTGENRESAQSVMDAYTGAAAKNTPTQTLCEWSDVSA